MPARPPLTSRMLKASRDSRKCAYKPHGEKVARKSGERYKLLVEVDLLADGHPAFHPRPMYYNV